MLDTNTLIYLIKRHPASVAHRVRSFGPEDRLCMSFVSYAELLKGAEGSSRQADVLRQLEFLLRDVPVRFPSDNSICTHYAAQVVKLKKAGTPIGGNDLWIGCHALAEQAVLVTNNTSEFIRIDGLVVENWV
jgi:tRNA(fMet)-specific endonuclease VapC